jgi:hypothetical protein
MDFNHFFYNGDVKERGITIDFYDIFSGGLFKDVLPEWNIVMILVGIERIPC